MKLLNIHNHKRQVYVFLRDEDGTQHIKVDRNFYPYFFEPNEKGKYRGFDGQRLHKVICQSPSDVKRARSHKSYESDVIYTKRYLLDKVKSLNKTAIKFAFLDIEVVSPDGFPNVAEARHTISCITIYNSGSKEYKTWYINDFEGEKLIAKEIRMLRDFIAYLKSEAFDIIMAWNVDFDYEYLYNRCETLPKKYLFGKSSKYENFAKAISPIDFVRPKERDDNIFYPAGTSIIDYMEWFRKFTLNKERSYALDAISQKYLNEETWGESEFGTINEEIKGKNKNDVRRMVDIETKCGLIPYFDEIRRMAKCLWEDLYHNSRVIDQLILQDAKKKNVILPMKPKDLEKEEFQGAYREAFETGVFYNIGKFDLGSAYPTMIVDFCLDPANIVERAGANIIKVEDTYFEQNANAILPSVAGELLKLKAELKDLKKNTPEANENYETICKKYDAIKSMVNSVYGVMGNRFFRLYDKRVASATTYLVRNVLKYVQQKLELEGNHVIYVDTDSIFSTEKNDVSDKLNGYIADWAKEINNSKVTVEFEYEGYFSKLLILAKCRYFGYVVKPNGKPKDKPEVKGVEVKRNDSSKFLSGFQRRLIDKVLDGATRDQTLTFIELEIDSMKDKPIEEIAFPCKLGRKKSKYKTTPIFVRALENTQSKISFKKKVGEVFYYIYVEPTDFDVEYKDEYYTTETPKKKLTLKLLRELESDIVDEFTGKNAFEDLLERGKIEKRVREVKKPKNVLAFDRNKKDHIEKATVDWNKMAERNVWNKVNVLFEALKWELPC